MGRDGTISSRWVRARKQHRCDVGREPCLQFIQPGTRYRRLYGAAEPGDPPYVLKLCEACFGCDPAEGEGGGGG